MKKSLFLTRSAILMLVFFHVQPGFAKTSDDIKALQREIKALREGQTEMQKDLQEIKKLLQAKPAPPAAQPQPEFKEAIINIEGASLKGDKNAKLVLIEFSDYQCPYCSRHVRDTASLIEKEYVETGKLKHVFMDFPLPFHQNAQKASEAANCAGDQGKFWEMHDKIFSNQQSLKPEDLIKHSEAIGLDVSKFKTCLDSGIHAEDVKKRMAEGQKAGITGTPAFLLGFIEPDGKVKAVKKIVGAQPYASFKAAIDELLGSSKK